MVQKKARASNTLRALIRDAHMDIRELAREAGIGESTLHGWANRGRITKREHILTLAHIIGCEPQALDNLVPDYNFQEDTSKKLGAKHSMTFEELDMHFSFGGIKTTSMVLDGSGEEAYVPINIHTHYDPQPARFLDEVMHAKKLIQQEEQQKNGKLWNSEKYHLSKIVVGREPIHEDITLGLWFKPRDHYTGLATRRCLDDPAFRKRYLEDNDWYTPVVGMSMSMGVDMTVISADGQVILTQRGQNQSVHQGMFNCSVSEAVSPLLDRSTSGPAPDMYRCASRGFAEELGLKESVDFDTSDILFLSFTVDTHYALYGLRGMVKVRKSAEEILQKWHAGVKDKRENKQMFAIPFTPEGVSSFVFSCEPFAPGGLVCLYHTLVHEFGREEVDGVIAAMSKEGMSQ
jgi:hypothetical protein